MNIIWFLFLSFLGLIPAAGMGYHLGWQAQYEKTSILGQIFIYRYHVPGLLTVTTLILTIMIFMPTMILSGGMGVLMQNPNIENIYLLYTLTFAIILSIIACSVGRESAKWHYAENEEIHNKTVNAGWALYFGFYLSYCTLVLHHFNFINF